MYTNELPDKMEKKLEDAFKDINKYSRVIKELTACKREVIADVKSTIETINLKQGESLESERMGVYVKLVQGKQSRLSKEVLPQLGVSEEVIRLGTITKDIKPYLKVAQKRTYTNAYHHPKR